MTPNDKLRIKTACDKASDALADLGHYVGNLSIESRNIRHEIQATGEVDLEALRKEGAAFRKKADAAVNALIERYKLLDSIFGEREDAA